ncbi:hypothetical protein JCM10914A_22410 [Paenibacillus sp. JCM 10914]
MSNPQPNPVVDYELMLIIEQGFRSKQIVTPYLCSPICKDLSPLNTVKEIVYGLVVGIPINKYVERCDSASPDSIIDVSSPLPN